MTHMHRSIYKDSYIGIEVVKVALYLCALTHKTHNHNLIIRKASYKFPIEGLYIQNMPQIYQSYQKQERLRNCHR